MKLKPLAFIKAYHRLTQPKTKEGTHAITRAATASQIKTLRRSTSHKAAKRQIAGIYARHAGDAKRKMFRERFDKARAAARASRAISTSRVSHYKP